MSAGTQELMQVCFSVSSMIRTSLANRRREADESDGFQLDSRAVRAGNPSGLDFGLALDLGFIDFFEALVEDTFSAIGNSGTELTSNVFLIPLRILSSSSERTQNTVLNNVNSRLSHLIPLPLSGHSWPEPHGISIAFQKLEKEVFVELMI